MAAVLRAAGFLIVTLYDEYGDAESKIADPVLIYDCGLKGRVLLTGDQDLVFTWAKEIAEARIAVFVTTNNNEGPKQWGPRIIAAQRDMVRELGRRTKPFTGRISTGGRITQVRLYEGTEWRTITTARKTHLTPASTKPDLNPPSFKVVVPILRSIAPNPVLASRYGHPRQARRAGNG